MKKENSIEQNIENIADLLWMSQYTGISIEAKENSKISKIPKETNRKENLQHKEVDSTQTQELHTTQQTTSTSHQYKQAKRFQSPKSMALSNYREWERAFRFVNFEEETNRLQLLDEEKTAEAIATQGIYDLQFINRKKKLFSLSVDR